MSGKAMKKALGREAHIASLEKAIPKLMEAAGVPGMPVKSFH